MSTLTIILNVLAPPVSVFMKRGVHNDFAISLLLTLFFFIPGILHAFYITTQKNRVL
ncbi:proteolipid membrane potential modulator [Nonlabens arenilitoris]|uniref:Proteolipid membrane potential modulator n=1 Tax=Nonlabens arenilitoris TaxID=1217969 RepID=A0A2S7U7E8_9FLAO|nr:YqaE/Pmp3 family membrane protein [Nonlabens arenilitoris]PQJ30467.1 proteolipid membrane potential modulator [Nonlabens arenilitoris]